MSEQLTSIKSGRHAVVAGRPDSTLDRQIARATNQVRIVEISTSLALVIAIALGAILAFCLIDAWVFSFSQLGRLIVLISVAIGCLGLFAWQVLPLALRKLNPLYSARLIEQSTPGLKNSLLNYLTLREQRISKRVKQMLHSRAVHDVSRVPVEQTADRSALIRIGLVVCAMVLFGIVYKLFSPKDPFHSLRRLATPLAEIARPTRVWIELVDARTARDLDELFSPPPTGHAEVFFGESVEIGVRTLGLRADAVPALVYSSVDGELVDQVIPFVEREYSDSNSRVREFAARLDATEAGIQRNIRYRVVAGDAESETYTISVSPRPTLTVTELTQIPPAYTELPVLTQGRQTDIRGLEGTKIQIRAMANLSASAAYVELLRIRNTTSVAAGKSATGGGSDFDLVKRIEMQTLPARDGDEELASATNPEFMGEFVLRMNAERSRGLFSHYRLKLVAQDGASSMDESIFPVVVEPDLGPEVEFVSPTQEKLTLPANGRLPLIVRADDADFKISWIEVSIEQGGKTINRQRLAIDQPQSLGPVQSTTEFVPRRFGLREKDMVFITARAADNRSAPGSGLPDPTIVSTRPIEITIGPDDDTVPEESSNSQPEGSEDQNQEGEPAADEQDQNSGDGTDADSSGGQGNQGTSTDDKSQPAEGEEGSDSQQQGSETGGQSEDNSQTGSAGDATSEQESDQDGAGEKSAGSESTSEGSSDSSSGGDSGANSSTGSDENAADQSAAGGQQNQESDGNQSGDSAGDESSSNSGPANDGQSNNSESENSQDNSDQQGTAGGDASDNSTMDDSSTNDGGQSTNNQSADNQSGEPIR